MKSYNNLKRYLKKITNGPDIDSGMAVVCEFVLSCLLQYPEDHEKDIAALNRFLEIVRSEKNNELLQLPRSSHSKNPYLGICATRSPMWAQAPVTHANPELKKVYHNLVSLIVSKSVVANRKKYPFSGSYLTSISAGYRALRNLSNQDSSALLENLKNPSFEDIEKALIDVAHSAGESIYIKNIETVYSLYKLIDGQRYLRAREVSGVVSDRNIKWVHGHIDEFLIENTESIFDEGEEDFEEYMTVKDIGGDGDDIDFIVIGVSSPDDGIDNNKNKINERYQALNIGKNNQKLLFSWSVLTKNEQAWLVEKITSKPFSNNVESFLLIALLTGREVEQIIQARVVSNDDEPEFEIEYLLESSQLRVRIKKPNIRSTKSRAFIKAESHIVINLPLVSVSHNGRSTLESKFAIGGRVFDFDAFEAKLMIDRFLKNQPNGYRVKLSNIRSLAASLFANHANDPSAGALLLDGVTALQKTVRHYLTVSSAKLRSDYEKSLAYSGLRFPSEKKRRKNQVDRQWVGTDYCLKDERLKAWILNIQKRLEKFPEEIDEVIKYHNIYTIYTIQMFSHAVFWRGNKTPISNHYDLSSGFIIMNDKSLGAGYNMRYNALPSMVVDQINNYLVHASRVKALVNLSGMKMMKLSDDFFFLTDLAKPRPVRAGLLLNVSPKFPGRRNALRLHMRSALSREGVPGELIDAVMGHWHNGMEPYSNYSSLSPSIIRSKTLPVISKVMEDMGWTPIHSKVLD